MAAFVIFWGLCGIAVTVKFPKLWRAVNIFCCGCSVFAILYVTLFDRSAGERFLQPVPFHFIIEAKEHIEILRSTLMNAFLFVPFGLSLPFAINKKTLRTIKITLVSALVFSVCIETAQYIFGFGRAETDDILCNAFGTFVGTIGFLFDSLFQKKRR